MQNNYYHEMVIQHSPALTLDLNFEINAFHKTFERQYIKNMQLVQDALNLLNLDNPAAALTEWTAMYQQKAEILIAEVENSPTIKDSLRPLKKLKNAMRYLRLPQTLQELLIVGNYQDLLLIDSVKTEEFMGERQVFSDELETFIEFQEIQHQTIQAINSRHTEIVIQGNASHDADAVSQVSVVNVTWPQSLGNVSHYAGAVSQVSVVAPLTSLERSSETRLLNKLKEQLKRTKKIMGNIDNYNSNWSQFQLQRNKKPEQEIEMKCKEMKMKWRKQMHSYLEKLGFGIKFFTNTFSQNPSLQVLDPFLKEIKLEQHARKILDYLCDIVSDLDINEYINAEHIELSFDVFGNRIGHLTREFIDQNKAALMYKINSQLIISDIKRREIQMIALLFGKEADVKEHLINLQNIINIATQPVETETHQYPLLIDSFVYSKHICLNCMSNHSNDPNVRLELIFDRSLTSGQINVFLREIMVIFPGDIDNQSTPMTPIIRSPKANVVEKFCASKEILAQLGIRAIIMGEYQVELLLLLDDRILNARAQHGVEAPINNLLNFSKNQNFSMENRIYSIDGSEVADGYKATADFTLNRGGEPYCSPIGWRRISVNLGLSHDEFDKRCDFNQKIRRNY